MCRFDGAYNWPEMRTYTRKLLHLKFNLKFIEHNIFLTSCCCFKKNRTAVLKFFNRWHKTKQNKKKRRRSAASPPHHELFTQRISGFSDSKFLCCNLVEIEDVITPHKITLFKHKSWTEKRIRCRQKCRYLADIFFSFRGRTKINSKQGVVTK